MSNRDPDARDESLPSLIEFAFRQQMKNIHTAYPATVEAYDPATKRARVQPSLMICFTDSTPPMLKPPLVDVPVRQNAVGGHMIHQQIDSGDVVLMIFTERGLENFKSSWGSATEPSRDAFFSESDGLAIPWGREDITPVQSTGWIVQHESGESYISLDGPDIRLVSGDSTVLITPDGVTINSAVITMRGATETMVIR